MSDYLDNYGSAERRRERLLKRVALVVAIVVVVGGGAWLLFRDFREERQVKNFFALLGEGNYADAYAMWGCTPDSPCRDYSFEKFMDDWQKGYSDSGSVHIGSKQSCEAGIIQDIEIAGDEVKIWVGRQDGLMSYAPWDTCNPRFSPTMAQP